MSSVSEQHGVTFSGKKKSVEKKTLASALTGRMPVS